MQESSKAPVALLEADAVSKVFGPVRALHPVSVQVHAGSVHAITGENGAGKSTLMKILAGVLAPTSGTVRLRGQEVRFPGPKAARDAGVSIIFQEFTLLPNLTVAENMFLGRNNSGRANAAEEAAAVLARLGVQIDPGRLAKRLTVGEQQIVEIARGVATDASVFIFDEPTAALNATEAEKLQEIIGDLKRRGKAVFYISHRLEEIFQLCDTVTVLKDGAHVRTCPVAELTEDDLVSLMVGRAVQDLYPVRTPDQIGAGTLQVSGLRVSQTARPVDLQLRRGEILGLAGLEGQGQREILRAIAGAHVPVAGKVVKTGGGKGTVELHAGHQVRDSVGQGIGFVPGDRKAEGLYLDLSIADNIAVGAFGQSRLASFTPRTGDTIRAIMEKLKIRAASARQIVGELSGGNQQKVLLARWMCAGVDVLLIEEPTRGVDIGAKADIYQLLRTFVNEGGAILVSSSELAELIGLCDRILVVREGGVNADIDAETTSEADIMAHALRPAQYDKEVA